MADIIIFPNRDELNKKRLALKQELSELIFERDELRFVVCKNIKARYLLLFGEKEYKIYEYYCTYRRFKRKISIIRGHKNRGEDFDEASIDAALDKEFEAYKEKLQEKLDDMEEALERSKARDLSDEENEMIKKLYRGIVKALHPDINPNASEQEIRFLHMAIEAFDNGDLDTIRLISELFSSKKENDIPENILKAQDELIQLEEMVNLVKEEIQKIKSAFPYTEKELLEDEALIKNKLSELDSILKSYEEAIKDCKYVLGNMTGENYE